MPSKIFQEILDNVPKEVKRSVSRSMKIAAKIDEVLEEKGLKQSDLAKIMKKKESEISKWLSGNHNFTIDTIDKIENALDAEIISITLKPAYIKSGKPLKKSELNSNEEFTLSDEQKKELDKRLEAYNNPDELRPWNEVRDNIGNILF